MYFDAMMTRKESLWRAKFMYWAVFWFGPRWSETALTRSEFTEDDVARALDYFQSHPDVSLEEIEHLDSKYLRGRSAFVDPSTVARFGLTPGKIVEPAERPPPCFEGEF